jgi:hypothetical protein
VSFFTRIRRLPAQGDIQKDTVAQDDPEAGDPNEDRPDGDAGGRAPDRADAGDEGDRAGTDDDEASGGPDDEEATAPAGRPRGRHPVATRVTTLLACLLVAFALIAPNDLGRFTPEAFVRVPLEGLIGVALALVLPARPRRITAVLLGLAFGLLAIVKTVDLGFFAVLDRPFNLVFDWPLLSDGVEFLTTSMGRAGAIGVVIVVAILAVAVLVLMVLSVLRLDRVVVRHSTAAARVVTVLGVVWGSCAVFGAQIVPGLPVAAVASGRSLQVPSSLRDHKTFAAAAAVDAFRDTPGDRLLTALRGKDVLLAFVESYGQAAVTNPRFAPRVDALLDDGTRRLRAAGFGSRSAYLTSPTAGGGSWLAHSTLLSGLWVDNQRRYENLVKTDRLTLNRAFKRAGWRTVGIMPGTTRAWPEGAFYGYDKVYDRWHLGYQGPRFNWGTPPDQYTLSAFQRFERAAPHHVPVMAEMPMVTSHAPWAPTPRMIDWADVGDGSVFNGMPATGAQADAVWRDPGRIRDAYRGSIEYSLTALISYVRTYGDDDLVVVFLGDHQAAPVVSGTGATHNVPITIVARDPAVLNRISGWGWQDGLRPGATSPVWPMSSFRDRFLTAFGSTPQGR